MIWDFRQKFATFAVLVLVTCLRASAQAQPPKVVQFKLQDYGWQLIEPSRKWPGSASKVLSIDRQGRVLVGFTIPENDGSPPREQPGFSFHIVRFDRDGRVDLSLVLPTSNLYNNGFYLGAESQIFTRTNELIQWSLLGSGDVQDWQPLVACPRNCEIIQSPSRRTMVVHANSKMMSDAKYDQGVITNTLVDTSLSPPHVATDCLRLESAATEGRPLWMITDNFAYGTRGTDQRRLVDRWPICQPQRDSELPVNLQAGAIRVLNDELFLIVGMNKTRGNKVTAVFRDMELIGPDGQVKFLREMPKHDVINLNRPSTSSERGDRFAFVIETWRGGSDFWDTSGKLVACRVAVYAETGQELASIQVHPVYGELRGWRGFDLAMSPDGRRIAILDQGAVTVVDLE
jgi:hypothetical protein